MYFLSFNCRLTTFVTKVNRSRFWSNFRESVELLLTGNECSLFLLLSRLKMDHLSFVFSLLWIVSVTTTIFGSAIKANNPNGEVKKRIDLCYCLWSNFLFPTLKGVSLEILMEFVVPFLRHAWTSNCTFSIRNVKAHEKLQQIELLFTISVAFHAETGAYVNTFAWKIKLKRLQFNWNTLRFPVKGFYLYF